MNIKRFLYDYMGVIYLLLIVITVISKYENLHFVSESICILFYTFYFILAVLGIYSLYKTKKNNVFIVTLFIMPFLFPFLIPEWKLLIPLIGLLLLLLLRSSKGLGLVFFIQYSLLIVVILISIWLNNFGDFSKSTILKETLSPNKQYNLIEVEYDEGNLGGNVSVVVEKIDKQTTELIYCGILKKKLKLKKTEKTLCRGNWGSKFDIEWISNDSIKVNNEVKNIDYDGEWKTYFINN